MHRLVEPQALDVGPIERPGRRCSRHLARVEQRLEGDIFALRLGSTRFKRSPSGKPIHGMTIDQPSTQRMR